MAINSGKVVVGGLVAGVVANVLDFVFQGIILKPDFEIMQQRLNLDPAVANNPVPWIIVDFILGFLLIVTYVGFRTRWGPGPKTAIYAGLVIFVGIAATMGALASIGVVSIDTYMKSSALQLVTMMCAALAGSYLYKES
ncbi:MAG TPA: hypothetical protein VES67_23840 [Vicinamibacterales bacterium]|nr:hypothetical protein [Vicinamibacterales bacterium]